MFRVVGRKYSPVWCPIDGTATMYVGQIVRMGLATPADSGVVALGAASGSANASSKYVPYGVIIGTNLKTPVYNSTYKTEYITSVNDVATMIANPKTGQEGMYVKGDLQPMVLVDRILPDTMIEGEIRNSSYATVQPEGTVTTGDATADYTTFTTAATLGFTAVDYNSTAYFRTGGNAGVYRVRHDTDTGTTQCVVVKSWPSAIAVGDKVVSVPLRVGMCRAQFDSTSQFIDGSAALTSNYFNIIVERVMLETAGKEKAIFRFSYENFLADTITRN